MEKNMKKLMVVLTTLLASSAGSAYAVDGPYLSLGAGMSIPTYSRGSDPALEESDKVIDYYALVDSSVGYNISGAVGYGINDLGRLEIEIKYQKTENQAYFFNSNETTNSDFVLDEGDLFVESLAVMFNGYVDFKNDSTFTPYAGLGLGYVNLSRTGYLVDNSGWNGDSTDTFAYQGMAGVDWAVTEKISVGVKYTYFGTLGMTFNKDTSNEYSYSYNSNNFSIESRFSF